MAQRQDIQQHAEGHEEASGLPLLGRLNARGFRLIMVADWLVVFAVLCSVVGGYIVLFARGARIGSPVNYLVAFAVFACLFIATYYFGGLYERELRLGQRAVMPQVVSLSFGPWLLMALVSLLIQRYYVPRGALPAVLVAVVLGVTFNRMLSRKVRRRRLGPPRVLLVGAPDEINIAQLHLEDPSEDVEVVGYAASASELVHRVEASDATEVLLLSGIMLDQVYPEPLGTLERMNVGVLQRVSARDTLLGLEGVREVGGMPFVALRRHTFPNSRARFKRTLELLLLLIAAVPVLLMLGFLALYVLIAAGRPVLFWQVRVGRDGQPFRMVKFRTLRLAAAEDVQRAENAAVGGAADEAGVERGADLWKTAGTPPEIPALLWLRRTRLDELPQLWNVLKGEMSLVGPRPFTVAQTAHFTELIRGYARRHEIAPGITGLAQIYGRYHTDPEYKLGHDLQYLVNWSPVLDLQILLRTVWVVLTRRV